MRAAEEFICLRRAWINALPMSYPLPAPPPRVEPPPPEWLPVLDRELLERDAGGFDLMDEPELLR